MNEKKSLFKLLPLKQVFVLGLLFSFFCITTAGFFFLLFRYVI